MVYTKDFQYIKPKKSFLQTFHSNEISFRKSLTPLPTPVKASSTAKRNTNLKGVLKPYFKDYCQESSIHGIRYLTDARLKHYEKTIWLFIIIATSMGCIFVYTELAELYHNQRLQTTVSDSVHPVFMVNFPSVGICLRHRLNWLRLQNDAPKKFLPPDVDAQTLNTFYTFFELFDDIRLYAVDRFAPFVDEDSNFNLTLINDVDILAVIDFLTFSCEEVLDKLCIWRYKKYNCCDLFMMERTEYGHCYVFNSAVGENAKEKVKRETFYPYHNSNAGEGTGLEVNVLLNEEKIKPESQIVNGIYVMIKQPEQWHAEGKFVNYNTYAKLAITAQQTETDKKTRVISPSVRRCIFEDETTHKLFRTIPGLRYWRGNCITRCHQEYILKYCKCNLSIMFPANELNNFTSCKPSDFKCIYENANIFSQEHHEYESQYIDDIGNDSMSCNCLNSCNQLLFDGSYSSFPLEGVNSSDSGKVIHLDVHYQTPYFIKYRTAIRYTFVELLANFGGIVGFFLGASLLSAVELIYYFSLGLYIRFHEQFAEKYWNKNSLNSHKSHVKFTTVKMSAIESNKINKF